MVRFVKQFFLAVAPWSVIEHLAQRNSSYYRWKFSKSFKYIDGGFWSRMVVSIVSLVFWQRKISCELNYGDEKIFIGQENHSVLKWMVLTSWECEKRKIAIALKRERGNVLCFLHKNVCTSCILTSSWYVLTFFYYCSVWVSILYKKRALTHYCCKLTHYKILLLYAAKEQRTYIYIYIIGNITD